MTPQLLEWDECHPLPWRIDTQYGVVDADGFPIGLGGTDAQRQAFCDWLAAMVQVGHAVGSIYDNMLGGEQFTLDEVWDTYERAEGTLDQEDDPDEPHEV